jgi:hypothetical protein
MKTTLKGRNMTTGITQTITESPRLHSALLPTQQKPPTKRILPQPSKSKLNSVNTILLTLAHKNRPKQRKRPPKEEQEKNCKVTTKITLRLRSLLHTQVALTLMDEHTSS